MPRILIVDDSKVARTVLRGLLRNRQPDLDVIEAEDGPEALDVVRDGPVDLAILDIHMQWMTGLDLAQQIRRIAPATKLAVLTANVQTEMAQEAHLQGIPFFRKPSTGEVADSLLKLLNPPD